MDKNKQLQPLMALRNIGPKCAIVLWESGICDLKTLKKLGPKETLLEVFSTRGGMHMMHPAFLYALYGAIHDIDWKAIPLEKKEEYKKFVRELKTSLRPD
jgi:hypothetical protein